jgi:glycosyltransferase involved in cell wall biosynthesis
MKENFIKQKDRKKILLLTDDIRVHSGVAQIGREIVTNTIHKYNWCQLAGAVQHPDIGHIQDLSEEINKKVGIDDAYCRLYPVNGYGDEMLLKQIIALEKPDAIFLITDPRYFTWLFHIENEIRKNIPIAYLNIWDNYPAPMYNKEFYESCDALFGISKQTVNINKLVLGDKIKGKIIKYIPHGLNDEIFKPLEKENVTLLNFHKNITGDEDPDKFTFKLLFNSRNIRRKNIPDLLMAWRMFTDRLSPEEAKKCLLILHTELILNEGTDLGAVIEYLCPHETCKVRVNESKLSTEDMNLLYNSVDGVILLSNAEGWGLSLTEAILAAKPIIAVVTGGMQDQMRFENEKGEWLDFSKEFPSNHKGTYKNHGEWAFPVFPSSRTLVGSPQTPYIYDEQHRHEDVVEQIHKFWSMSKNERIKIGQKGREWAIGNEAGFTSKKMGKKIEEGMDELFNTWVPRKKFTLLKDTDYETRTLPHNIIY